MVSLRKALLQIEESTIDNQFGNPSHERPKIVHEFLKKIGLSHLHFKHAYRCLPVLERTPSQLSWTWAHTESIKKISKDQAIIILEKRNKNNRYDEDIQKVTNLSNEKTLTLRQKLAPHLRVNVSYTLGKRSMLKGTMPVVFPRGEKLPQIKPAKLITEYKERARRKDKKTSDEALVPAIRLFATKD